MKNLILISQVAYSMLAPILLGLFIGNLLDKWLNLNGIFLFIFLIMGIISAFTSTYKLIMNVNRDIGKDEKK
ncbi:AtpZ/AtpI family protein [Peptoniphilaceae bacterium SGI.131]